MTTPSFRLVLAGQSLIERPLHDMPLASSEPVRELICSADLAITNLEVAIHTPNGWPTRDHASHVAPESVLDTLAWFGFRAVATASNHAFDLGPAGIVAGLEATRRRSMITAGTGIDASAAAAAGTGVVGGVRVAMLGAVAATNPPGSHALDARDGVPARPGVNRLRVDEHAEPDPRDLTALLDAVHETARVADLVVVYLHNHYWADPQEATPTWVRKLARQCIDEGAAVVFGHGTPVLQGVEFYRGHLIAYGLGSFIFHTKKPLTYGVAAWESALVDLDIAPDGTVLQAKLHPLTHGKHLDHDAAAAAHGAPIFAAPRTATEIVQRLARLSAPMGARVACADDGTATIRPTSIDSIAADLSAEARR